MLTGMTTAVDMLRRNLGPSGPADSGRKLTRRLCAATNPGLGAQSHPESHEVLKQERSLNP